jgi:hypothetical protein
MTDKINISEAAIAALLDGVTEGPWAVARGNISPAKPDDPDFLDNRFWPYAGVTSGEVITERTLFNLAASHGWQDPTIADDFDVVEEVEDEKPKADRFQFVQAAEFGAGKPASWIIKHVLPRAELIVLYGESGAGKSFMALDLMGAIARGAEWRGHKTTPGLRCGYIAAEGAAGFRNRLHAYALHHEIALPDLPIGHGTAGVRAHAPQVRSAVADRCDGQQGIPRDGEILPHGGVLGVGSFPAGCQQVE